ncbi:hypothetical protein DFS34DRAFT_685076 [Phlyctochytrium arcticum]|nr:hypothetical protein DFS34DRAFT_685076 [Phlyctochytrium arcticum]
MVDASGDDSIATLHTKHSEKNRRPQTESSNIGAGTGTGTGQRTPAMGRRGVWGSGYGGWLKETYHHKPMDQPTKHPSSTGQTTASRNPFPAPPTFPNPSLFTTAKRRNQLPGEPPFGPGNMPRANMLLSRNVLSEPPSVFDCNWCYDPPFLRIHPTPSPPLHTSSKPFPLQIWLTNESLPILHRQINDIPGSPFPYHH